MNTIVNFSVNATLLIVTSVSAARLTCRRKMHKRRLAKFKKRVIKKRLEKLAEEKNKLKNEPQVGKVESQNKDNLN